jgi:hypothetical protein
MKWPKKKKKKKKKKFIYKFLFKKQLKTGGISASTISQGSLSTLDDENAKRLSIPETPVYMEKTLEQSCQSFECFNIVKQHEHPSTSAAAAAAAAAAEEKQKALLRKSTSISEKSVLRKSSAYFSHTIRKMKEPRRPSSPAFIIKEKKPLTWWRKLFSRA